MIIISVIISISSLWIWPGSPQHREPLSLATVPASGKGSAGCHAEKHGWGRHPDKCAYANIFLPFAFPMVTGSYLLGRAGSNILNCWGKFSQLIKLLCVLCWSKILFMSYVSEGKKNEWKKELLFCAGRQWNDDWWDYALTLMSAQCQWRQW